jgi:tripartite-type tricarboxylate transporter receptor subunit TctC
LNRSITAILARDDVKQKMAALYFTPAPSTPAELTELIVNEKKRWDEVIARLNLTLD